MDPDESTTNPVEQPVRRHDEIPDQEALSVGAATDDMRASGKLALLPAALVAIADRVCELGETHGGELAELGDELLGGLAVLLRRPTVLDVGAEHRDAAVALTTAFLDGDRQHQLLLSVLSEHDDRARVDPEWRLATTAALAQLVADVLVVAVVALSDDTPGSAVGEAETAAACRELLSRLVQLR
jgi:hypothetical protein